MRKAKSLLCLILILAMTLSVSVVSFASSVSHVSYSEDTVEGVTTVTSSVFVAGQDKEIKLYTAVYDAEGNFVKAIASNGAKTGLLKTSVVKEEGQVVKSFVWNEDITPMYLPAEAEELTAEDIDAVNVTINNKPVSAFGIEKLELGKEYDIDVNAYKLESIPEVNVTTKESTITTNVTTDTQNLKTVVTIAKGANGKETVTKTVAGSKTFDVQRYNRASDTITFNWVVKDITDADFMDATSSSTSGWRYDVVTNLSDRTSKTFTVAEDQTFKKISVKFATYLRQENIIVVKPAATAAESYKADPKTILVTSTGAAATWVNDANVVDEYAWGPTSEGYNTGCIINYGKKSNEKIANIAGTDAIVYYPVQAVDTNSNGYETGSRTCNDRSPNTHQKQIYSLGKDTDLLGMPYIVGASTTYTNGVVSFYIADDAEVVVLSRACGTITFAENDGEFVAHDSKTSSTATAIYTNNASATDTAWLIKKGYIKETDISQTGANSNKKHILNDGTTVNPISYTLRTWDYVMRSTKVMPTHGYVLPDKFAKAKNLTYKDILDLWVDSDFEATEEEAPLIKDFKGAEKFEGVGTFRYPENLSDYNNDKYADTRKLYEDYNFNVAISGNKAVLQKPGFIPSRTIYVDREGEANGNGTGTLVNYPEAMGLEDDYVILPALNLVNGPRFGAVGMAQAGDITKLSDTDIWRQAPQTEWASFTVTRDAKVTVMTDGRISSFAKDTEGWNYTLLSGDDCVRALTTISDGAQRTFANVWTKYYPAGSKVVLTTPQASSLYITFIDEWDSGKELTADLTGITINGEALEGFDADTTEYTYAVGVNAKSVPEVVATPVDYSAKVKVIKPTEFPGNLKVVVNNEGVEKTYTINFEAPAGPYSSNIQMAAIEGVNYLSSTMTLHTNFQNGDSCFNDRLSNANMKMKNIAPEYIGKEWVRGALGWQNDTANAYSTEWKSATLYEDWASFDIARDATIHIICDKAPVNGAHAKYLTDTGWGFGYNANGYVTVYTSADQKLQTRYTKHFTVDPATGKARIELPNIGGLTMCAVIVYDGWTE